MCDRSRIAVLAASVALAASAVLRGAQLVDAERPCCSSPSKAEKHDAESRRGRHSQSIAPLRPTSASGSRSPIEPHSSSNTEISLFQGSSPRLACDRDADLIAAKRADAASASRDVERLEFRGAALVRDGDVAVLDGARTILVIGILRGRKTCSPLPLPRRSAWPRAALRPPVEGLAHRAARERRQYGDPVAAVAADERATLRGIARLVLATNLLLRLRGSARHTVFSLPRTCAPGCGFVRSYVCVETAARLARRII
jgi:hypothetical protein